MATIFKLFAVERPLRFYTIIAFILAILAVLISIPLLVTYIESGLVPRFPTAILSTGICPLSAISFVAGLILETVTIGRREAKQLWYLSVGVAPYKERRDRYETNNSVCVCWSYWLFGRHGCITISDSIRRPVSRQADFFFDGDNYYVVD